MNEKKDYDISVNFAQNDIGFVDIFNLDEIQLMQDTFSETMGVGSLILKPDGTPITKPSNFCKLCEIVRNTEKGHANCMKSDMLVGQNISNDLYLKPCQSAGLFDTGAKITIDGKHIANWLIGQVRNEETDYQKIIEYGDEIGADKVEFLEALDNVPVMSVTQFQKVANMLFLFANELSEKAYRNLQLKNQLKELERTNELLHKSEESLSITLHSIGDGVISTDKNGLITSMNPIAEEMCGWKLADALGKSLTEVFVIVNSETRKSIESPVNKVLELGKIVGLANHTKLISKTGKEYHIADSAAPIKNKEGVISGVVLVFSDVTEKYQSEAALLEREEYLKQTQIIAQLGTYKFDIVNNCWSSSPVLDIIFGIEPNHDKSFEGWASIIHPDWQKIMTDYFVNEVIGNKFKFNKEYKIIRKSDGVERWVHGLGEVYCDENQQPLRMIGTIQDITDRVTAEELLRKSEEKYRNIFENVQDVFYQVGFDGKFIELSPSAKNFREFDDLDLSEMHIQDFYANIEDRQNFIDILNKNGEIRDYELKIKGNKDDIKHVSINARIIYDESGNPLYINGALRDISKRKKVEEELYKSEKFLKETQEIAQLGTFTIDLINNSLESSEIFNSIFGINSVTNLSIDEGVTLLHPDWQQDIFDYFYKDVIVNQSKFNKKFKIIRKNNQEVRWVHALGEVIYDTNEQPVKVIGTVQDITKRKNANEALRKSEELYRSILNASPDDITVTDLTGKILLASPVAYKIFGFEREDQVIGHSAMENLIPEDQQRAMNDIQLIASGKIVGPQIYKCFHTNGSIVEAEVSFEFIRDSNGTPYGFVFIIRDISERRKVEETLRNSQKELKRFASHLQNVREEERVLLAREIHDDLGQILIAIKIDLGLLKQNVMRNLQTDNKLDTVSKFDDLYKMVDNTLKSARRIMTNLRPEVLDLLGLVDTVKQHLIGFNERYKIISTFQNNTSAVELTVEQSVALFRIIQEALNNVAKHSKAVEVNISLNQEGNLFVLEITDNGDGFDDSQKIKSDSYGLIGMKERVYLLDGELNITSKKGSGTCVKVSMPLMS